MASVNYQIGADEDVEWFAEIFTVLCKYLPVSSSLSQDDALEQLVKLLPQRTPGAPETHVFHYVALCMAGQTPYRHPSQEKLSSIVVTMIRTYDSKDCGTAAHQSEYPAVYYQTAVSNTSSLPGAKEFVNEQAFISRTDAALGTTGNISYSTVLPLRRAFEVDNDNENKEANIMAAALWILNDGTAMYRASFHAENDIQEDFNYGPKYQTSLGTSSKGSLKTSLQGLRAAITGKASNSSSEHKRWLTPQRWSFWKQGFLDAASESKKNSAVGSECGELAAEAAKKMNELEARSANTSRSSFEKEPKVVEMKA